jgi:hypothetical protein
MEKIEQADLEKEKTEMSERYLQSTKSMEQSHKSNKADIVSIPSSSSIKNEGLKVKAEKSTKRLKRIKTG